jgi:PEP-CTERM motif
VGKGRSILKERDTMHKKGSMGIGVVFAFVLIAPVAHAGTITLGQKVAGPLLQIGAPGTGNATGTITVQPNTAVQDNTGFTVTKFAVNYTAGGAGAAGVLFGFRVGFTDTVAEMVKVTVSGNTDVTETAGATGATLTTPGSVTNAKTGAVEFTVPSNTAMKDGANATNYAWNKSGMGMVAANTEYNLNLFTGVTFTAAAKDDRVTLASTYEITISSVAAPEPSTWVLMVMGIGGVGFLLRWQGRRGREVRH